MFPPASLRPRVSTSSKSRCWHRWIRMSLGWIQMATEKFRSTGVVWRSPPKKGLDLQNPTGTWCFFGCRCVRLMSGIEMLASWNQRASWHNLLKPYFLSTWKKNKQTYPHGDPPTPSPKANKFLPILPWKNLNLAVPVETWQPFPLSPWPSVAMTRVAAIWRPPWVQALLGRGAWQSRVERRLDGSSWPCRTNSQESGEQVLPGLYLVFALLFL